jgi:formiminotetrahydrofolate cyclodeaminase
VSTLPEPSEPGGGLGAFLDALEAPAPSPCGGTAAAISAAMAAALVAMVGRGSSSWQNGAVIAAQAMALRARLTALGEDDASAFAQVLVTMRERTRTPEQRDVALGAALVQAAEVPLRIGEAAADVAELAAIAAVEGAPHLRPDAAVAAVLAKAAVRAATHLVEINLAVVPGDHQSESAARLSRAATAARERALG